MSLNELLEEIFDTDVISLEDYMNRINEVENFFLNFIFNFRLSE